jgi:ABC-2 type transport system permease protein
MIVWSIVLSLLCTLIFAAFWLALSGIRSAIPAGMLSDMTLWIAIVVWLIGFFYAFIEAMRQSVIVLFDRGDLDLLVASPVPSKVIFASRLLSVALKIFLSFGSILIPITLFAVPAFPQLFGIYPALVGLSLSTSSLAMLLTLWLVRLLGAKRARTLTQVFTALLTAILFLGFQLPNLLRGNEAKSAPIWSQLQTWLTEDSPFTVDSWVWFPARAIFLDPISVVLTLGVSCGLAWFAVETLHHSFISGSQQSVTDKKRLSSTRKTAQFADRLSHILLFKEWRIIRRNPYLISATFMQILFLIPALIIVLRGSRSGQAIASFSTFVTVASIVIGGSLASTMTQICVAGEEAPDLLKSAPIDRGKLRQLKLLAALIPVWLLLSPLFGVLLWRGEQWFIPLIVFLSATACAALLRLWNARPIALSDIAKRRQDAQGDPLVGMLEVISIFLWGCVGFTANQGQMLLTLIALIIIGLLVAIAYWRSRAIGTSLGF